MRAQTAATLSMAGSIVDYDGFLASGAASITPALRYDTPDFSLAGQLGWTIFESGNGIFQATAAAAWLAPGRSRWRFELAGSAGAYEYAQAGGNGHLLARSRLHFFKERSGGWVGLTSGASFTDSTEVPVELGLAAWHVYNRFSMVGTVTGIWLGDARHLEVAGAAKWAGSRLELEARAGARPWANTTGFGAARAGVWCDLSALIPLGETISFVLSGGKYPSDPVRRVLGAAYATAGIRLTIAGTDRSPPLSIPGAIVEAMQNHMKAGSTAEARLEVLPHAIRVYLANASSVELMGDFTDWGTVPLKQVGPGIWELQLQLEQGVHRLNLRIDGGDWLVPAGARPEQGEFGGVVGVIVVR